MILDQLSHHGDYAALHPLLPAAFAFLLRPDLDTLAVGRYEIDGEQAFAMVNDDPGRGRPGARLETHRHYLDVQYVLSGQEIIGWLPLARCRQRGAYDAERDLSLHDDSPESWLVVPPGHFALFLPHDAHAPLAADPDQRIHKVVVKVAVV